MGNVTVNVMETDAVFWWATIFCTTGPQGLALRRNGVDHHRAVHASLNIEIKPLYWRVQSSMTALASRHARPEERRNLQSTPDRLQWTRL